MVVFGQRWFYLGEKVVFLYWTRWVYWDKRGSISANVVLFGQTEPIWAKVALLCNFDVFGQNCFYLGKIVVFGQKWLHLGKTGSIE